MHVLSEKGRTTLQNVSTRFGNAMRRYIPDANVLNSKDGGKWYTLLRVGDNTLYSYHIEPNSLLTIAYKGGFEKPRELLFTNDPNATSKRRLTHKQMFEKMLEHWHLERLHNQ